MGLILGISRHPAPRLDGADDGLAAFVDMDVFDADPLLAFATNPLLSKLTCGRLVLVAQPVCSVEQQEYGASHKHDHGTSLQSRLGAYQRDEIASDERNV